MSTNGHHHSPLLEVGPLHDGETGFSCSDGSTGLRLNLRQINGQGLEQILSGQFSGKVAAEEIREVLMEAMERVGGIMREHGIHAVRLPQGLDRDM